MFNFLAQTQSGFKKNYELQNKLVLEIERTENKRTRLDELNNEIKGRDDVIRDKQAEIEDGKVTIAQLSTKLEEERKQTEEKLNLLQQAEKNMTDAFENLSNKILEEKK